MRQLKTPQICTNLDKPTRPVCDGPSLPLRCERWYTFAKPYLLSGIDVLIPAGLAPGTDLHLLHGCPGDQAERAAGARRR
jgi:hypothetical protein